MKKIFGLLATVLMMAPGLVHAEAIVGKPAPGFEATDASGKTQSLAANKGKWIVLEWANHECPYVKKHYGSGNMQQLQKDFTAKGVVWMSVLSSAKGKEGYTDASTTLKISAENKSAATAILLDTNGKVGKAYGAKTTPHMFIINPEGTVVYAGAIDDNDSSDPKVIATSKNYVRMALDEGLAGKKITVASSRPYGCGVKY